jgi:glycosyltransferase involved in cell wall biosynthesis
VRHGSLDLAQVATLYSGADAFVLASLREPYGTVYGEAMATGLPVVGWRAGNLPHLATHDREGLVLPPGDLPGLASALQRLAEDEGYRRRLGLAAQERAASFPTWAESAARLFAALREVAGTAAAGVSPATG